jgi:hypothetical protein
MKMRHFSNKFDYGTLHIANETVCDVSFVACGLSLGVEGRSVFQECTFSDVRIKKCFVGFPVFSRCHFRNVTSDRNGVLIYGAAFKECTFSGSLKNVVIGFSAEYADVTPEHAAEARKFHIENIETAATSNFAIDATAADLEFVGFRGEAIIPYVRCARNQAMILKANDLFERLRRLGRAESNRAKSDFFLGTGVMPGNRTGIATFNRGVRDIIPEIEKDLNQAGIDVIHYETAK